MAVRAAVLTGPTNDAVLTVAWTGLLNGDTGAPVEIAKYPDKTIQVVGDFGTGGTITMEGSNDGGTTWGVLHDPQGADFAIQNNEPQVIAESPLQLRPDVSAGNGSTDLDVYVVAIAKGV